MIEAANGELKDRWERHARQQALLANCNRDPKQQRRPFEPHQFNPYAEKNQRHSGSRVKVSMGAMMDAIFGRDTKRMAKELSNGFSKSDPGRAGEC